MLTNRAEDSKPFTIVRIETITIVGIIRTIVHIMHRCESSSSGVEICSNTTTVAIVRTTFRELLEQIKVEEPLEHNFALHIFTKTTLEAEAFAFQDSVHIVSIY